MRMEDGWGCVWVNISHKPEVSIIFCFELMSTNGKDRHMDRSSDRTTLLCNIAPSIGGITKKNKHRDCNWHIYNCSSCLDIQNYFEAFILL